MPAFALIGPDQAFRTESDQVGAARLAQRLDHQVVVLRVAILDEGALQRLLVRAFRHEHALHGARVHAREVHGRGHGGWRGVEVLHLLGIEPHVAHVFRQLDCLVERASGVRRHQIRHHELLQSASVVGLLEQLHELLVHLMLRLAHHAEYGIGNVLRRHAQLPAHMVLAQLAHERLALVAIRQHVIEADARTHEDLLHARQLAQFAQKLQVVRVVGVQLAARLRREAMLVTARAATQLRIARRLAIVRRRAAHVVDVSLELRVGDHLLRLFHDGFMASHLHDAPLMERQRAKRALAEAAAIAGKAELHLADRRDAAGLLVHGVVRARIRQAIHGVHLRGGQRLARRVLHHELVVGIGLHQAFSHEGVAVAVLHVEAARVLEAVLLHVVERGQKLVIVHVLKRFGAIHRAVDERDVGHVKAGRQRIGDLHDGVLPHAVADQVGAGIKQDRALQLVRPIIIMSQTAKRGFDTAQHDGNVFVRAANQVAVNHRRAIGPKAHLAAGRERIGAAMLLGNRIVVHHRIHVAGGNQESQSGLSQNRDAFGVAPIRLADHADLIVVRLEQPRDDGHAERRVVDVSVAAHEHEVAAVPTALFHIGTANRQERAARRQERLRLRLLRRRRCRGIATRCARLTRTSGTLRLVQPMRALRFARAVRFLEITTASARNGAFAQTFILTRHAPRVLLSRRSPLTLSPQAALRAILCAATARRLTATIACMPLGCTARPLACIPLFHGTAYLGAPLDAISNGMGSS